MLRGFSSITVREATCASCINFIREPLGEQKCRIFSFEWEKYSVPHLDTVTLNHARYCRYYESIKATKLDEVIERKNDDADLVTQGCEVEETATIRKNITYPGTDKAQEDMRSAFMRYLEKGYRINRIELRRSAEISQPGRKESKNEEINISISAMKE